MLASDCRKRWTRVQPVLAVLVASVAGCTNPQDLWEYHALEYTSLCDDDRYVEAAFEYEYGLNQVEYAASRTPPGRHFMGSNFPKEPLFGPLAKQQNIAKLMELAKFAQVLPRLQDDIRGLLAKQLGKPKETPLDDLMRYYRDNSGRLIWDEEKAHFVIGTAVPKGERLPKGFEPIASAGVAEDGYPRRIRCLKDDAEMVYVPAGRCWVSDDNGRWIEVAGFYIDRLEVTNEQYVKFCKATGRPTPTYERRWKDGKRAVTGFDVPEMPVTCISWDDAMAYAKWTGKTLPNQNEWLRAANGDRKQSFPWGEISPDASSEQRDQYAVFGKDMPEDGGRPATVGGRPLGASPFGVEDMAGNVSEFLASHGGEWVGEYCTIGGSYRDRWPEKVDWTTQSSDLRMFMMTEATPWNGFRCVLVLP